MAGIVKETILPLPWLNKVSTWLESKVWEEASNGIGFLDGTVKERRTSGNGVVRGKGVEGAVVEAISSFSKP